MTEIKLDMVQSCNLVERFINYATLTAQMHISGTIGDGVQQPFSCGVTFSRTNTKADVYLKNLTSGKKMPATIGARINPYIFKGGETCTHQVEYDGSQIRLYLAIVNNTGSNITLVDQDIQLQAVLYEVPYVT